MHHSGWEVMSDDGYATQVHACVCRLSYLLIYPLADSLTY